MSLRVGHSSMQKFCSKKADIYPIRELDVQHVIIMDQSDGRMSHAMLKRVARPLCLL